MGHDSIAHFLTCGMQRDGQRVLLLHLGEALDAFDDAACRKRDLARSDVEALLRVDDIERSDYCIVVQEGLALAHSDKVGHTFTEIVLNDQNLINDLSNDKVSGETFFPRRAKHATHRASYLGGEADSEPIVGRRDADGLN